jgi:hypothetical protein
MWPYYLVGSATPFAPSFVGYTNIDTHRFFFWPKILWGDPHSAGLLIIFNKVQRELERAKGGEGNWMSCSFDLSPPLRYLRLGPDGRASWRDHLHEFHTEATTASTFSEGTVRQPHFGNMEAHVLGLQFESTSFCDIISSFRQPISTRSDKWLPHFTKSAKNKHFNIHFTWNMIHNFRYIMHFPVSEDCVLPRPSDDSQLGLKGWDTGTLSHLHAKAFQWAQDFERSAPCYFRRPTGASIFGASLARREGPKQVKTNIRTLHTVQIQRKAKHRAILGRLGFATRVILSLKLIVKTELRCFSTWTRMKMYSKVCSTRNSVFPFTCMLTILIWEPLWYSSF